MFMQRKPHPNGLLIYLLACAVEHPGCSNGMPFVLDFLPHVVVNDTAPDDTVLQFKERWLFAHIPFPDLIGDAAFGSEATMTSLNTVGTNTLFSMPSDSHSYLWDILSAGLTPNTWRAAINEEGIVASIHQCQDSTSNKIVHQQVFSSIHTGTVSLLFYFLIFV